jgi:hypothetical protein
MLITQAGNVKAIFTSNSVFALLSVLSLSGVFAVAKAQPTKSIYTSVDEKKCRTIKSSQAEAGDYLGRCVGTAGYTLLVAEGDLRQNVTVVTPGKKEHSLNLWSIVSPAFSIVGPTVEWRIIRRTPVALILRYNASEDPEKPDKKTSYLVVAKITADQICVTDKVAPGAKANEEARRLADQAATKPCLKPQR